MTADFLGLLEPIARETAVDSDGWIYDVDTGEVLGLRGVQDQFRVTDETSANWALKIRSDVEAEIVKIDAQFAALKANMDARRREQVRRLSYWDYRFAPALIAFARSKLVGKVRTWQGNWGKVSFRRTPERLEILDDEAAIAFVETWTPERVKVVRSVGLKDVLAAKSVAESATGESEALGFAKRVPEDENVSITTGIEVKGGGR